MKPRISSLSSKARHSESGVCFHREISTGRAERFGALEFAQSTAERLEDRDLEMRLLNMLIYVVTLLSVSTGGGAAYRLVCPQFGTEGAPNITSGASRTDPSTVRRLREGSKLSHGGDRERQSIV